jgi:pimeloyl-ACP methyl ester carboxylesterase
MKLIKFTGELAFMKKHFITVEGVEFHYRIKGNGPLMVLLHPSPRSGKMMEPLINLLSSSFTVTAPDTPGYGKSGPLPERANSLYDYVPLLNKFIEQVAADKISLYGSATGAQLAIAYSLIYPGKITHLYLDNCAHFTDEECNEILQQYFPDFSPKENGSHLEAIWQQVCDSCLYFPWYNKKEENRVAISLPPHEVIQSIFEDYVLAGANYADAYKAAFLHERAVNVQALKVPATIFKWAGSPLLKYMERLLDHKLPANIKVVETPVNTTERFNRMKQIMETGL